MTDNIFEKRGGKGGADLRPETTPRGTEPMPSELVSTGVGVPVVTLPLDVPTDTV